MPKEITEIISFTVFLGRNGKAEDASKNSFTKLKTY
jgi:hypothetical protein